MPFGFPEGDLEMCSIDHKSWGHQKKNKFIIEGSEK